MRDLRESDLKLSQHQSCSMYAKERTTIRRRERLMFINSSAEGSGKHNISSVHC